MDEDKFKQLMYDYLKENLSISVDVEQSTFGYGEGSSDTIRVRVKLILNGIEISSDVESA